MLNRHESVKYFVDPFFEHIDHCKLCTAEKYYILNEVDHVSLNVRSELLSKCRHKAKWKLKKLIS